MESKLVAKTLYLGAVLAWVFYLLGRNGKVTITGGMQDFLFLFGFVLMLFANSIMMRSRVENLEKQVKMLQGAKLPDEGVGQKQ